MTWSILVPLDGTNASQRAIPWADRWAGGLEANVTLLHVQPPRSSAFAGSLEALALSSRAALEEARRQFHSAPRVDFQLLTGSPSDVIATTARASHDLVVMASHGPDYGMRQLFGGGVTARVIRTSGTPVVVIPPALGARVPRAPRRVLVPLDGSETSAVIFSAIAPMVRAMHWLVVLLGVVSADGPNEAKTLERYLGHVGVELRRQLIPHRTILRRGEPNRATIELAEAADVDLIAMSTRSQVERNPFRLGSVTQYVLGHAVRPVLALHPVAVKLFSEPFELHSGAAASSDRELATAPGAASP